MNLEEILEEVSIERMYEHILKIEGTKHHEVDPKKLNETADYIKNKLKDYGLTVSEQAFTLEGLDFTFRNVEGVIGEGKKPEILLVSHYDNVDNTPGANDNGSGIAAMLEAARVLAKHYKGSKNFRFVSFTLEELHPVRYNNNRKKAKELGLMDDKRRVLKYHTQKMINEFIKLFYRLATAGNSFGEAGRQALVTIQEELTDTEREYLEHLVASWGEIKSSADWIGKTALVGSTKWVEQAIKENKEIIGMLNLETIGYTSKRKHSQKFPSKLFKLLPKYKTNLRKEIGDFIGVIGDKQSRWLAKKFCAHCKHKQIELPYVNIGLPFSFETIANKVRALLRSDHAPFWKHGIPALMITDTADFRYPYYHTEADTIDKLDFEFIKKVCQAAIACMIDLDTMEANK
ncbi:MAG: M28 family peptidase [Candidatus Heimdallarchaeota archaeon]